MSSSDNKQLRPHRAFRVWSFCLIFRQSEWNAHTPDNDLRGSRQAHSSRFRAQSTRLCWHQHICQTVVPDSRNLFFNAISHRAHHLSYSVYAVENVQSGAVIPVNHNRACRIYARNCSKRSYRRGKGIAHLQKFHTAADLVLPTQPFQHIFIQHLAHRLSERTSLWDFGAGLFLRSYTHLR